MTPKKQKALVALLTQPTKEKAAAAAAGITSKTLRGYLDDPEFQAEYKKAFAGLVEDANVYCEECSKRHLPLWERADEIEAVAVRFPGVSVGQIQEIVRSGLDHGFSFETALVGARLAYAMQTGQEELFSLDDVAAALGCTKEEAAAEMERHGIQGMTISTLPGFEWLLGKM